MAAPAPASRSGTRISISAPKWRRCARATAASARSRPSSAPCATAATARAVASMELEHYPGMTEAAIEAMIDQAFARFDIRAARVVHRIGELAARDQIVLVAVASAHRGEAFQACEFLMDYLKTRPRSGRRKRPTPAPAGSTPGWPTTRPWPAGASRPATPRPSRRPPRASRAPMPWPQIAVISLGASVGAVLRWLAGALAERRAGTAFRSARCSSTASAACWSASPWPGSSARPTRCCACCW